MRVLRKDAPVSEYWEVDELAKHLMCPLEEAKEIMNNYHKEKETGQYGPVEKGLILDYIEQKQREQREREARHQSDLAIIEKTAVLKEQVKTLKEQVNILKDQITVLNEMSHSSDARAKEANKIAIISIIIAFTSLIVAIIDLISKV